MQRYVQEGRLRRHRASRNEITSLLAAVERDLADAGIIELSPDRRFALALPQILGPTAHGRAGYLNTCRVRRNRIDYDGIGFATHPEANELITDTEVFRSEVTDWLAATHPDLAP
ncbi:MAG: hypothetical protein ACNA76_07250 [Anaerosomatales bacterium]|nr:hypothetical protein [Coriobacteriia bacterium]